MRVLVVTLEAKNDARVVVAVTLCDPSYPVMALARGFVNQVDNLLYARVCFAHCQAAHGGIAAAAAAARRVRGRRGVNSHTAITYCHLDSDQSKGGATHETVLKNQVWFC